jgi:hypothetical protein
MHDVHVSVPAPVDAPDPRAWMELHMIFDIILDATSFYFILKSAERRNVDVSLTISRVQVV